MPEASGERLTRIVLGAIWPAFCLALVHGFPPCVDLPAHAAQLQSMVELLRGDPAVAAHYELHFPIGYDLQAWLALPVAFLFSGAVAVRLVLWVTMVLYPWSLLALARAFGRPAWVALLGLPLVFNFSYWYGLLPGLLAQPLSFFALAAYVRWVEGRAWRWALAVNLLAAATFLTHLLAFAVLVLGLLAITLSRLWGAPVPRGAVLKDSAFRLAVALSVPVLLSIPRALTLANRAVTAGDWPATEYALAAHVNWFFKYTAPEGKLSVVAPLVVTGLFALLFVVRRKEEPRAPLALFVCWALLYAVTPKTLSGIFLVCTRLAVLVAGAALFLADPRRFPRWLRGALAALTVLTLAEAAAFHWRFSRAIDGLEAVIATPPKGPHGYVSLEGRQILGSGHVYLDHLGQWWTGTWGGVGHNFFADADHHAVRFRPGGELPAELWALTPEVVAPFDEVLIFGGGERLPACFDGWDVTASAGKWRKVTRRK
ncbi:MAG: hypothetical protein IT380_13950 [Myxococcales bacterium]|nr:hypothetical protein [Myxococcales bacterium]